MSLVTVYPKWLFSPLTALWSSLDETPYMPVDLIVPISTPVRLETLARAAEQNLKRLFGIEKVPSIIMTEYREGLSHELKAIELSSEKDNAVQFQLHSIEASVVAMVHDFDSLPGLGISITPGRTPLSYALGAALALACAEEQRSVVIDKAGFYTTETKLPPSRFLDCLAIREHPLDLEELGEIFQKALNAFGSDK